MDRDQLASGPLNLGAWLAEMSEGLITPAAPEPDGYMIPPALKHSIMIQVSEELLMDTGVIPDTREHKSILWRTRLRWRLSDGRERAAELAYRLIAGHDMPDRE